MAETVVIVRAPTEYEVRSLGGEADLSPWHARRARLNTPPPSSYFAGCFAAEDHPRGGRFASGYRGLGARDGAVMLSMIHSLP